jgi:hypothetical protein
MGHILANECNALFIDLSPDVVAEQFADKSSVTKIMYIAFKVAKFY